MKRLRGLLMVVLALTALLAAFGAWVVNTGTGSSWSLRRLAALSPQPLAFGRIEGTLADTLTLHDVRYGSAGAGVMIRAQYVKLQLALSQLPRGALHIEAAEVEDLLVAAHDSEPDAKPRQGREPLDLRPPLDVIVERLAVRGGIVRNEDDRVLSIASFRLEGRWTQAGIFLDALQLDAEEGELSLAGALEGGKHYTVDAQGRFRWRLGARTFAGTFGADMRGDSIEAALALSAPTTARLSMQLDQRPMLQWSFVLDVPRTSTDRFLPSAPVELISAALRGRGDASSGTVGGRLILDGTPLQLEHWNLSLAGQRLRIDATTQIGAGAGELHVKGAAARVDASLDAQLEAAWRAVRLPAEWVGQRLDTGGELSIRLAGGEYSARGQVSIGPPDRPADISLEVSGSPQRVHVERLAILQESGRLSAQGYIELDPVLAWRVKGDAVRFNPGALLADWPGELSFTAASQGRKLGQLPQGELHISDLRGRLRGRPVSGAADLSLGPEGVPSGELHLRSGESRIGVRAAPGERWNVRATLVAASLNDWAPQLAGRLHGRLSLKGAWPQLDAEAFARASAVEIGASSIAAATLRADIENVRAPSGTARIEIDDSVIAGYTIASARAKLSGSDADHTLSLDLRGQPLSLNLLAHGTRRASGLAWRETIEQLTVTLPALERLALQQPATVLLRNDAIDLSKACLANTAARLCLAAEIQRDPEGRLFGEAILESPEGHLSRTVDGALPPQTLLTYRNLRATLQLDGDDARGRVGAVLDDNGFLRGALSIAGLGTDRRPIEGELVAHIPDISALSSLSLQVANVHGSVELSADIDGTLEDPVIVPQLHVANLALDLPALGIELREGVLRLEPTGDELVAVSGSIESGEGDLRVSGTLSYDGNASLHLDGEQFLAADLPGARVVVSPHLQVRRDAQQVRLSGRVLAPSAHIDVQKLPRTARVEKGSEDVVIVDARSQPQAREEELAQAPLYADLELILGDEVVLSGFGLQASVAGQLSIHEAPNEPTTGSGELRVSGEYQAYGQDLTIAQGSLLYANTPLGNPALRIVAVRQIDDDVTAGLRIGGTARAPQLTVFSEPETGDANALSYLVAGRPLDVIGEQEGDALQSAARSLGTAAGGFISERIGSRLGLDTVSVEENESLGGAAFTVGEYLSPRLYLSYGVGLFEPGDVVSLRYRLTDELVLRAERGANDTRAGIEYRMEK